MDDEEDNRAIFFYRRQMSCSTVLRMKCLLRALCLNTPYSGDDNACSDLYGAHQRNIYGDIISYRLYFRQIFH